MSPDSHILREWLRLYMELEEELERKRRSTLLKVVATSKP